MLERIRGSEARPRLDSAFIYSENQRYSRLGITPPVCLSILSRCLGHPVQTRQTGWNGIGAKVTFQFQAPGKTKKADGHVGRTEGVLGSVGNSAQAALEAWRILCVLTY